MNTPISLTSIQELFNYNYWARDCQLRACEALTNEQFLRNLGSSFASVRDTLVHMLDTEGVWLERWRGHPPRPSLSTQEFPSVSVVSERWAVVEQEIRGFLATLREEDLVQPLTYVSQKGDRFSYERWRPMIHLINHQSYHRGQVATMLRQLKVQPPGVDFLAGYRAAFVAR